MEVRSVLEDLIDAYSILLSNNKKAQEILERYKTRFLELIGAYKQKDLMLKAIEMEIFEKKPRRIPDKVDSVASAVSKLSREYLDKIVELSRELEDLGIIFKKYGTSLGISAVLLNHISKYDETTSPFIYEINFIIKGSEKMLDFIQKVYDKIASEKTILVNNIYRNQIPRISIIERQEKLVPKVHYNITIYEEFPRPSLALKKEDKVAITPARYPLVYIQVIEIGKESENRVYSVKIRVGYDAIFNINSTKKIRVTRGLLRIVDEVIKEKLPQQYQAMQNLLKDLKANYA